MKVDELKEVEVVVEMMVVEEMEVVEAGKEEVLGIIAVSC